MEIILMIYFAFGLFFSGAITNSMAGEQEPKIWIIWIGILVVTMWLPIFIIYGIAQLFSKQP